MPFNFEKFEHAGGRFTPKASIRSNGSIGLSQGAVIKFQLSEGEWFANLYYDKSEKAIGIKPTREAEAGTVKIITRSTPSSNGQLSYSSFISAKSFLEFYGISVPKGSSRSFPIEWNDEHHMLIISLKQPTKEEEEEEDIPF